MPTNDGFSGVSNCYVFKSRLQEYAQKVGLPTPVYETIKEGPSHEPSFRSAVIVNDVRYESLPGFFNRKAAEQSAAEVALVELAKLGEVSECISQPVHETGLCKNLLQEYAQKMNYAIPMYQCRKDEAPGRVPHFSCTVEIGGIQYIGAAARTKKEAEIKAARTALLAIQSSASELSGKPVGKSQLTVIPCRKRGIELVNKPEVEETVNVPKAKKARFKKKMLKKLSGEKTCHAHVQGTGNLVNVAANLEGLKMGQTNASEVPEPLSAEATRNCREGRLGIEPIEGEISAMTYPSIHIAGNSQNGHSTAANFNQSVQEAPKLETSSLSYGDEATRNSTAADSNQNLHETPNVVTPSMSYGDVADMAKEVNDATVHSTAAKSDQSGYEGLNVVISSTPYGDVITSGKEVNEASGQSRAANSNQSSFEAPTMVTSSVSCGDVADSAKEVNVAAGVGEVSPMVNNPIMGQMESSCVIPGINQQEEMIQASISRAIGSQ